MTNKKNHQDSSPSTTNDTSTPQNQTPSGSSGFWVAAIMIGLLVLIVAVEMLRSKS